MIGTGDIDFPDDAYPTTFGCMVMWRNTEGNPTALHQGDTYPTPTYSAANGFFPDMILNENDKFVGSVRTKTKSESEAGGPTPYYLKQPDGQPFGRWKINSSPSATPGNLVEMSEVPKDPVWVDKNDLIWGEQDSKFSVGLGGGSFHQFDQGYSKSVEMPDGGFAVFNGYSAQNPLSYEINDPPLPQFRTDDQWQALSKNSLLSRAVDFSTEGRFAICQSFSVWHNGLSDPVSEWSPGLPDDWKAPTENFLLDTTRHGWTLAVQSNGENPPKPAKAMIGLPLFLSTPTPSEGLDAVSFTVSKSFDADLTGMQHEFWIMVPAGGDIPVRIRSGACSATPITFGGDTGSKVTASPSTVDSISTLVTFSAPADADGTEESVNIKLGELSSLSTPLRAKIMKPRVVKVSVWPLKKTPADPAPAIPTKQDFEEYLNDIYKKQINVTFDVTIQPASDSGLASNVPFLVKDPPSASQETVSTGKIEGNINVYVMGGHARLERETSESTGGSIRGITHPESDRVWMGVDGDANGTWAQRQNWLSTVTHEIGHVFFGRGHPDDKKSPGPAPLPLTDQRSRIMYSAFDVIGSTTQQRVCVKAEWDHAAVWLKKQEDDGKL